MKYLIYTIALAWATAWGYEFKHVQAQAQSTTPLEVADANMLPNMKPTMAKVNARRVYGSDLQFEYFWKPGTPTGVRTQEFIYKHYVILGTTPDGGYWTTPKIPIDAENVLNLDSLLKVRGFLYGSGWKSRSDADSVRLVNEKIRAIIREDSLRNALNAAKATIPTIPVTSVFGRTGAIVGQAGDYAGIYEVPLTFNSGVTRTGNVITNTAPDQTVTLTGTGGVSVTGTYPNFTVSRTTPTYNNAPSRTANTSYQLSTTRPVRVTYSYLLGTSLTLVNIASSAAVALQISQNNSTWITISEQSISKTVTVGVVATDALKFNIQGEVPPGWYMRVQTTLSGGGTATFSSGQEVID